MAGEATGVDPIEPIRESFKKRMETGDFVGARAFLEEQIKTSEPQMAAALQPQRTRLRLDPIAIAVMAVCGGILTVVGSVTLFH